MGAARMTHAEGEPSALRAVGAVLTAPKTDAQSCEEAGPYSMASVADFVVIAAITGRQQGADDC